MGILDESPEVSERIRHRCYLDAFPDVFHGRLELRSGCDEVLDGFVGIGDAPVGDATARSRLYALRVRIQTELKAADVEANVEWLIEVGLDAERGAVPLLGAFEVANVIDHRA